MSGFFRLVAEDDEDAISIDLVSHEDFSFTLGERFPKQFPQPVLFEADRDLGGTHLPTLFFPEPVVKEEFLHALRAAGVTNVDDYEVRIAGLRPNEWLPGYRAINIVGAVACADLARSEFESVEGMTFFDRLVLDPARARGADFFRLAEAHEYVIVSARLAQRLDLTAFPDVRLIPIET